MITLKLKYIVKFNYQLNQIMGTVKYKFTFNSQIDSPESIRFSGISADLQSDYNGDHTIDGSVEGVLLDGNDRLLVFVSSSGRAGRTWELEVSYNSKKLEKFPIKGTIEGNGFYTLNKRYSLTS